MDSILELLILPLPSAGELLFLMSELTSVCAAANAFHYKEVFYFLQLRFYVTFKVRGIRLVYVPSQPLI